MWSNRRVAVVAVATALAFPSCVGPGLEIIPGDTDGSSSPDTSSVATACPVVGAVEYSGAVCLEVTDSFTPTGEVKYRQIWTTDASGSVRLDERFIASDNGSELKPASAAKFGYDADNLLLSESFDGDVDGVEDRCVAYLYNGDVVTSEFRHADSVPYQREVRTYSAEGWLLQVDYDITADGVVDWRDVYTYRADGLVLSELIGEGSPYYWIGPVLTEYTRDEDGNLTAKAYDVGLDGPDWVEVYENDEFGNVLVKKYAGADGVVDYVKTYAYDGGLLDSVNTDIGADGIVDATSVYTYDGHGSLVDVVATTSAGVLTDRRTYAYDLENRLVYEAHDIEGDGLYDYTSSYAYDDIGSLMLTEQIDAFGSLLRRSTYDSSCGVRREVQRPEVDP